MSLPTKATFILAGSFGAFLSFSSQQVTVETVLATKPNTTQLTATNSQASISQSKEKADASTSISDI